MNLAISRSDIIRYCIDISKSIDRNRSDLHFTETLNNLVSLVSCVYDYCEHFGKTVRVITGFDCVRYRIISALWTIEQNPMLSMQHYERALFAAVIARLQAVIVILCLSQRHKAFGTRPGLKQHARRHLACLGSTLTDRDPCWQRPRGGGY